MQNIGYHMLQENFYRTIQSQEPNPANRQASSGKTKLRVSLRCEEGVNRSAKFVSVFRHLPQVVSFPVYSSSLKRDLGHILRQCLKSILMAWNIFVPFPSPRNSGFVHGRPLRPAEARHNVPSHSKHCDERSQ